MEQLHFQYKAERVITKRGYVGVVASGDLEILVEPSPNGIAQVDIRTQTEGFRQIWQAIFDRFFQDYNIAAQIQINDFGATPGVVNLRLAQVVEVID
ncbi:malonate decarboxylase subunit delta [Paenibacillus allorhizosphaerae]|uniref:malonate decarboxylase subunit delta n=1 Tax=Paenibacillus allorhizosphaerae TaxID=2849866 RepID=UPI001C406823|nr:malonate decarboxylase subunit delta [Paenibacillus allorhizosphaerae]